MIVNLKKQDLLKMLQSIEPGESCCDLFQTKNLGEKKDKWFWNIGKLEQLDEPILFALYISSLNNEILGG